MWDLFIDSCSWQSFVSSYYVLTLFLHWFYKMKYPAIKILLLFLAGLFIGLWLRNSPNDKKKSEITVFKNKLLLVSLLLLAGCVRRLKSLKRFWPYLMSFRAASRPVSLSNYITFDVFFFLVSWSRALFMPSFYTHFIRFETMIWPSIELKKSLDIFWPRLKRKRYE